MSLVGRIRIAASDGLSEWPKTLSKVAGLLMKISDFLRALRNTEPGETAFGSFPEHALIFAIILDGH
jgi:hypothetical protein